MGVKVIAKNRLKYNGKYYGHGLPNGAAVVVEDKEAERLLECGAVALPDSQAHHLAEYQRKARESIIQEEQVIEVPTKQEKKDAALAAKAINALEQQNAEHDKKNADLEKKIEALSAKITKDAMATKDAGRKGK